MSGVKSQELQRIKFADCSLYIYNILNRIHFKHGEIIIGEITTFTRPEILENLCQVICVVCFVQHHFCFFNFLNLELNTELNTDLPLQTERTQIQYSILYRVSSVLKMNSPSKMTDSVYMYYAQYYIYQLEIRVAVCIRIRNQGYILYYARKYGYGLLVLRQTP